MDPKKINRLTQLWRCWEVFRLRQSGVSAVKVGKHFGISTWRVHQLFVRHAEYAWRELGIDYTPD
jgi:hypothetical protein